MNFIANFIYFIFFGVISGCSCNEPGNTFTSNPYEINHFVTPNVTDELKNAIAKQIYDLIDHFKQDDPIGLPFPIPDPIQIPEISQRKFMATLNMNPVDLHKISKFRIQNAAIRLDKRMEGSLQLSFDEILLKGNYTLKHLIGKAEGPFTVTIKDLIVDGTATLGVESDGKLRAQEVFTDMQVANMNVSFENLGILKQMLGKIVNSGDGSFFNVIKPYIIKDSKDMIKKIIDEKIDESLADFKILPNSIGTIDFAIAHGRKFLKKKYDPFKIDDIESSGAFGYKIHDIEFFGISSLYRIGDIKTVIRDKKAFVDLDIGTHEIHGKTAWEVSVARGMISRAGRVQFSVKYLQINVKVSQPIDLSKRLHIDDIKIDVGNIQILSSGLGTFDYLIEIILNIIPNLIRHQIMEVIRYPVIERIQQFVNRIDAEKLIKEKVAEYLGNGNVSMNLKLDNEL